MEVSESVSKEAYFGKSKEIKPMYRFIRVPPNITDTYTITSAGTTTPATIDIPIDTYNASKHELQFDMALDTAEDSANTKRYMFSTNPTPIQKLEFYSRNGQVKVIEANQLNDAYEIMWKSAFSNEEFQSFPRMNARTTDYEELGGQGFFLQPSRVGKVKNATFADMKPDSSGPTVLNTAGGAVSTLNQNTTANGVFEPNIIHQDAIWTLDTYGNSKANDADTQSQSTPYGYGDIVPYKEFSYTIVAKKFDTNTDTKGYHIVVGTDTEFKVRVSLPLGKLVHSFFAKNKDIHYGDIFTIRITWGSSADIYCTNSIVAAVTSRITSGGSGNSSIEYPGNGTPASGTKNVTISNLRLQACQESNPVISNALRSQYFAEGQHIIYDHYSFFRQTAGTSVSQSPQIRLSVGDGQRIKYLYWAPYSSSLQTNKRYDHHCLRDLKLKSFYTTLNSVRMQNNDIDLSNDDDLQQLGPLIKDSPLAMSSGIYKRNWFWCESFVGNNEPLWKQIKEDADKMQPEGKSLNMSDFLYSINTLCVGAQYQWTFVAVCQKEVVISAKGTIVV